ncbi:MAG: DUF1553 domain-containing protein [Planctomycetes bacterium]|nr:DUF1553 domain-containing protein [Planctomycetota bacterium]
MRRVTRPIAIGIFAVLTTLIVRSAIAGPHMMPVEEGKKTLWSVQPVGHPAPPAVKNETWVKSPIDRFVLGRLEAENVPPSPEADKRSLIRRVYFDLVGLPPTYEQVEAFVHDASPNAYDKIVDELLARPQFGERWARHWLDIARYADTIGYDGGGRQRKFPFAWTYRDYVIRALNDDKPYDRFVIEQIAADRLGLAPNDPALAALGFLTVGRQFLGNIDNITDDRIDVVGRGLMGLTIGCARCHDHKYDPIPTTDYYAMYGVFRSLDVPEPMDMPIVGEASGTDQQKAEYQAELAKRQKAVDDHLKEVHDRVMKEAADRADEYLSLATDQVEQIPRVRRRLESHFKRAWREAGKPNPITPEKKAEIVAKVQSICEESPELFLDQGESEKFQRLKGAIIDLQLNSPGAPPRAMAVTDGSPYNPYVFVRGSGGNRGENVDRRFLSVLGGQKFNDGSGRLELAKAIASADNPLTARVWVNRIWMHLIGEAIVRTPADFGVRGEQPTHPALLDYLARDLMDHGWSTKRIIRSIALSATYRQASEVNPDRLQRDPENRLISHMNRKRLEFEPLRDALLATAHRLDGSMFGRPVDLFADHASTRRAIYGFIDRQDLPMTLRAFDFASPDATTPQRLETTVPQQSLFMMNSPFLAEQAQAVAQSTASIGDRPQRINVLYERVLERPATQGEVDLANGYLGSSPDEPMWARYAQVLMLSNEFVFVD